MWIVELSNKADKAQRKLPMIVREHLLTINFGAGRRRAIGKQLATLWKIKGKESNLSLSLETR